MDSNKDLIYLRTDVKPILGKLFEEIGKRRPDDIVSFSVEWLRMQEQSHAKKK